jgi:uncharacterized repeat protein (TIGR02543 family)/LPXTG-motif cell wall-anchored protein
MPTFPTTPTKTGYTFAQWCDDYNTTTGNGAGSTITSATTHTVADNVTYYAQWTPITYDVEYTAGAGTGTNVGPFTVDYDETFTTKSVGTGLGECNFTPPASPPGQLFIGWKIDDAGALIPKGHPLSKLRTTPGTVTLVAQWGDPTFTVTYKYEGATGAIIHGPDTVTLGSAYTIFDFDSDNTLSAPTNYHFKNWVDEDDGTTPYGVGTVASWAAAKNLTLVPQWEGDQYDVIYDANNGTGATYTHTTGGRYGVAYTVQGNSVPFAKTGYTFTGWNTKADGTGTSYAAGGTIAADGAAATGFKLYAVWAGNFGIDYTVNFYLQNANGTYPNDLNPTENVDNFNDGTAGQPKTVDPDAIASGILPPLDLTDYTLDTSLPTNTTLTINGDGTTVFKFYYKRVGYTLTVDKAGGAGGVDTKSNVGWDSTVLLAPHTRDGYTFLGWDYEDELGTTTPFAASESDFVMPKGNVKLTAKWASKTYNVVYNYNYGGAAGEPAAVTNTVRFGSKFGTPTAGTYPGDTITRDGYVFAGWFSNADGTGFRVDATTDVPYTLSDSAPSNYYAKWVPELSSQSYLVEIYLQNASGSGYTKDDDASYTDYGEIGATVTLGDVWSAGQAKYIFNAAASTLSGTITAGGGLVLKLYYDRRAYQLAYDANGGSPVASETLRWGAEKTITAAAQRYGFTLLGWELVTGNAVYDPSTGAFAMGDTDAVLRAKWRKEAISTETEGPDGKPIVTPIDLTQGALPELDGGEDWKFLGWYKKGTNTKVSNPGELVDGDEITPVFARKYLIAYKVNETDGFILSVGVDRVLRIVWYSGQFGQGLSEVGAPLSLDRAFPTPTRPGYEFDGWWYLDGAEPVEIKSMYQVWDILNQTLYPLLNPMPSGLDVAAPRAGSPLQASDSPLGAAAPRAGAGEESPVLTLYARWKAVDTPPPPPPPPGPSPSIPKWVYTLLAVPPLGGLALAATSASIQPIAGGGLLGMLLLPLVRLLFQQFREVVDMDGDDDETPIPIQPDDTEEDGIADAGGYVQPPKTGESANVLLCALMLMMLSGGAAVVLYRRRREDAGV